MFILFLFCPYYHWELGRAPIGFEVRHVYKGDEDPCGRDVEGRSQFKGAIGSSFVNKVRNSCISRGRHVAANVSATPHCRMTQVREGAAAPASL